MRTRFSAPLLTLALIGCSRPAPEANITLPEQATWVTGELVVADGSASKDLNKEPLPLTYHWRLVAAPPDATATLGADDRPAIGIRPDAYGDYELGLVVNNGEIDSAEATATFTVGACGNEAPIIDTIAANPTAPNTDADVQLSAVVHDPDVDSCQMPQTMSWAWGIVSSPSGSNATISDAGALQPWFHADRPGDYTVALVITDDTGRSSAAGEIVVAVSACGDAVPTVNGVATPSAPNVGDAVTVGLEALDGDNGACDLEQTLSITSKLVSQPAGSAATLMPADGSTPGFVADVAGTYTLESTVSDGTGRWSVALTSVDVNACGGNAPTLDSITASAAAIGSLVTLTVSTSDLDNGACGLDQTLDVRSALIAAPAGSMATMSPSIGSTPAFVPDAAGDYVVRTWVSDGTGREDWTDTVITASPCGGFTPVARVAVLEPVVSAAGTAITVTGATTDYDVWLDGSGSTDADISTCGLAETLTYTWAFTSKPATSAATFNDATIVNPSFTPDVSGIYTLQLTVSDGTSSSVATASIEADPTSALWTESGYTLTFVDGESTLWSAPRGVTVDGAGNIYVVQNGLGAVTMTDTAGYTSLFSLGGYLGDIQDIEYYSGGSKFFVSSRRFDSVIALDTSGGQTRYTSGTLGNPTGLSLNGTTLAVADESNDRLRFYRVSSAAGSSSTGSEDFGGRLNNPWGSLMYGTSSYAATNPNDGEAWKTNTSTDTQLTDRLDEPRDIVRGSSGAFYVADAANGTVYQITDCSGGDCTVSPIVWGSWSPFGLVFASTTELLITDESGDALYSLVGTF